MKKFIKNDKGYGIVITLFTLVLLSIISLTLLVTSTNTLKTSSNERKDQSVYYYAEAGLIEKRADLYLDILDAHNNAINEYENQINLNPDLIDTIQFSNIFMNFLDITVDLSSVVISDFETLFSEQPTVQVNVYRDYNSVEEKITYSIVSTGTLDGKQRTVTQKIEVDLNSASATPGSSPGNVGDFAVYSKNNITFGYYNIKDQVKGHLASASNSKVKVNGWEPEQIEITHDPNSFDQLVNDTFQQQLNFNSSFFENIDYKPNHSPLIKGNSLIGTWNEHHNKTLTLTDNLKLDTFSTSSNLTFNIDVGDSDKILYVDNLTFNGTLNILGSGSLTIFVKDNLNFNYSNININGNPDKLNIYYAGSNKIKIANGLALKANLFIRNADLEFSGGSSISGSFYSNGNGKTEIKGGTVSKGVVFIMPNSNFTITGGANVIGTILCNDLFIEGGSKIDAQAGGGLGGSGINFNSTNPIQLGSIVEE